MNPLIILLIIGSFLSAETYSIADIKSEYPKIFQLNIYRDSLGIRHSAWINEKLDKKHFLKGFIKSNEFMVGYLVQNAPSEDDPLLFSIDYNDETIRNLFFEKLSQDSIFNRYFLDMACRYLTSKGHTIEDYRINEKYLLTSEDIMNVAVRFWYPIKIDTSTGRVMGYVCSGFNEHNNHPVSERNLILEAFCYSTIMTKKIRLLRILLFHFLKTSNAEIKKMEERGVEDYNLLTYRDRIWNKLMHDKYLKKVLKKEVKRKKDILPFALQS